MRISLPFGIDLGTTQTAAAIYLPGSPAPEVATDEEGRPTLPSVVRPLSQGRFQVGHQALEEATPDQPAIESVKRKMGQDKQVDEEAGDALPEDISAVILAAISARLRHWLKSRGHEGENLQLEQAVITVPAYFDAPQIEATRRAGELAGLQVAALIQEPTAAAIYHSWKHQLGDGTYLVYDLGGGTFDVSVIRSLYGEYQVLAIDGDNHLGGDDFDRRLADLLRRQVKEAGYQLGSDFELRADRKAFARLTTLARALKIELSEKEKASLPTDGSFTDRGGRAVDLDLTVTREEFEVSIDDLIETTIAACRRALQDARKSHNLQNEDIKGIFLVGGSTRVPAVRRRLQETLVAELKLSDQAIFSDEAETSVALGAALCASALCPVRFVDQDNGTEIAIHEWPTAEEPFVAGTVSRAESKPTPAALHLRPLEADTPTQQVELSRDEEHYFFSLSDFDAALLSEQNELLATVTDSSGKELAPPLTISMPMRPADARPAPSLALTNPAVLAKDINIDVVEDQRALSHTLIARGTHLPTTVRRTLAIGDDSGALVLRLFQHRLPIHTIVLPLPDDARHGAPVDLEIKVDQAMNITASGRVGAQTFWARVDRPSLPKERRWEEIEALMDKADGILTRLWGVEARRFEAQSTSLVAGIQAALRTDPERLQVLARRLEMLLDEYGGKPERSPGLSRIETLLDTIRRLVFSTDTERLGRSHNSWQNQLDLLASEVRKAWQGEDDVHWQEVADRVQATFESVAQDEYLFRRRDPELYSQTLLESAQERFYQLVRAVESFPLAADEDNRALQKAELSRIEEALATLEPALFQEGISGFEVPRLEKTTRGLDHLEGRLKRVHTLGIPRKGER